MKPLFLLGTLFSSFFLLAAKPVTYIYEKTTGKEETKIIWTLKSQKKLITLNAKNDAFTTNIEIDNDFITQKFIFQSLNQNDNYIFQRKGHLLYAEGNVKGRNIKKVHNIGGKTWLQDFSFNLKPFVESANILCRFFILNPNDFSLIEMLAKKIDTGALTIGNKEYEAQKIRLTLPGFKGLFWSGELWYDIKEKNMLMFRANEGPHTPITTIIFIERSKK